MTGLSTHVIRVWEKRYGAVVPERSQSHRRLFSTADVERLTLLRQATDMGHSIGTIAQLSEEDLRTLLQRTEVATANLQARKGYQQPLPESALDLATFIAAIRKLNHKQLEGLLSQASVQLGPQGLLQKVIAPLTQLIGEQWREGSLTAAQEHFASAVVRDFLSQSCKPYVFMENAPVLMVATPSGQLHELGAVMVAAAASNLGWRVTYLGPSLPASEIAGAAVQSHARAVALSIVYPADDPRLAAELTHLRRLLPAEVKILVGGQAAEGYRTALHKIGALMVSDLNGLFETLGHLRTSGSR